MAGYAGWVNRCDGALFLDTRFGNPMRDAGLLPAGKELAAWVFLSPLHNLGWGENMDEPVPFQAPVGRWRSALVSSYKVLKSNWF
jgi:hypothetical protein